MARTTPSDAGPEPQSNTPPLMVDRPLRPLSEAAKTSMAHRLQGSGVTGPPEGGPATPGCQWAGLPPQDDQGHRAAAELVRGAFQELAGDVLSRGIRRPMGPDGLPAVREGSPMIRGAP